MFRRSVLTSVGLLIGATSRIAAQQGPTSVAVKTAYNPTGSAIRDSMIQSHQVRVLANNDEWTGTGLYLNAGDCMMIFTGQGKVKIGHNLGEVDANGTSTGLGLLKGKIGTSAVFPVGQRTTFCAVDRGNVKLKVSDTKYEDNSGEFVVVLIKVPGQFIPAAEEYSADE